MVTATIGNASKRERKLPRLSLFTITPQRDANRFCRRRFVCSLARQLAANLSQAVIGALTGRRSR